ncbi:MAG: phage tail protein, partial [Bryobacterales bacterium]|nr:phage tail protein [Bryobacterales bacterium]
MPSLYTIKEQELLDTPIVLFECSLRDGSTQYWSSHDVALDGHAYNPRVLSHNLFELRYGGDSVSDSSGRLSLSLANADAYFAQVDHSTGWKGATILARFAFFDLSSRETPSDSRVLFSGIWSGLDESNESVVRISFQNRLGMQRQLLPSVRIQRRCPWLFPGNEAQRLEAQTGGPEGIYSRFYNCGYSAGQPGGVGNLDAGAPYVSCGFTRSDCTARGMFDVDDGGIPTRRFGGMEYIPVPLTQEKPLTTGNEAAYNGFVPLIYGTSWYQPPVVATRHTPEYTKLEALLGLGPIQGVLKVLANGVELPVSEPNGAMDPTGSYRMGSLGDRTGAFDPEMGSPNGTPLGNPYGSMVSIVMLVPASLYSGSGIPRVEVLVDGLRLQRFDIHGEFLDQFFTNNPAWVALDVLRRTGWSLAELDLRSFARAAGACDEAVNGVGSSGELLSIPRWRFNMALLTRRSTSEVLRGLRNACGLYLKHGPDGRLQAGIEDTLAKQHVVKSDGSNSVQPLNNGWPAYEFGDGAYGFSGIARRPNGEPSIRFWSRSLADTPNRLSVQFQDEFNLYQKDSFSLTDIDDVVITGQEISATISALGIANFSQAARILTTHLKKSVEGNRYVQFETSVRGIGLSPGDIITITYAREQLDRVPFRVLTIAPALDCSSLRVTAQLHSDEWYVTGMPLASDAAVPPRSGSGVPRPVLGTVLDADGVLQYDITERALQETDGGVAILLSTSFAAPTTPAPSFPSRPRLSLRPQTTTGSGTLAGGKTYYYGVTALDPAGRESGVSYLASAALPSGASTCSVTLCDLSFPSGSAAFNVYRGENPQVLMKIGGSLPISVIFLDDGKAPAIVPAPDENYDHANVYWRYELHPPTPATVYT